MNTQVIESKRSSARDTAAAKNQIHPYKLYPLNLESAKSGCSLNKQKEKRPAPQPQSSKVNSAHAAAAGDKTKPHAQSMLQSFDVQDGGQRKRFTQTRSSEESEENTVGQQDQQAQQLGTLSEDKGRGTMGGAPKSGEAVRRQTQPLFNRGSVSLERRTALMNERPKAAQMTEESTDQEPGDLNAGAPYLFKRKIANTQLDQKWKLQFLANAHQNNSTKNSEIGVAPRKYPSGNQRSQQARNEDQRFHDQISRFLIDNESSNPKLKTVSAKKDRKQVSEQERVLDDYYALGNKDKIANARPKVNTNNNSNSKGKIDK